MRYEAHVFSVCSVYSVVMNCIYCIRENLMKLIAALMLLGTATSAVANPFPDGNAQAGQKLFEQYKCNRCHAAMLGGDGSAMFTRADRKVHNAGELIEQIGICSGNVGANLSPQDKQHLGAYLNRYYNLK